MDAEVREAAVRAIAEQSGVSADLIEIVRMRQRGETAVVAATFRGPRGRLVRAFAGLQRTENGWAGSGGWTSTAHDMTPDAIWSASGGWGPADGRQAPGVAGGWVNEPTARSIRVTDSNGLTEEDTVESGVAILIWIGTFNVYRSTVELLDATGHVIRTGPMQPLRRAV